MKNNTAMNDDGLLEASPALLKSDAEVESDEEKNSLHVRTMLTGWELRNNDQPLAAIKPIELSLFEDKVLLCLPGFFDSIELDGSGRFFKSQQDERCTVSVNGRVRGQILIINAEGQDQYGQVNLRLSGVLPFEIFSEQPDSDLPFGII